MNTKVTESVEEYDLLKQADTLLQYKDWEIARLRACIVEMEEIIGECDCRTKRIVIDTI